MNENREKLHKLFDACLMANGLDARTQKETGLKPTVFFSFSGHVARCEIRVYDEGWIPGLSEWNMEFNFDTENNIPDEKVEEACAYLETVSIPKTDEELLRRSIADKEKNLSKISKELEALRKQLAEEVGANV